MSQAVEFLRLLWAVDHDLQQKSIQMQRTIGVTGPQRLVIRIVGRFPGISPGRLAGLLGAHPSTATGLSQRLVRLGLLRARSDPRDARRIQLGLTPRGRAVEVASAGTIEEAVDRLLATTRPAQMAAARAVLDRLQAILRGETTEVRTAGRARAVGSAGIAERQRW